MKAEHTLLVVSLLLSFKKKERMVNPGDFVHLVE
jgi:hypothetical protein